MRSRDGTRTLCVVCPEKKMESTTATIDKSTAINNKSSKAINNDSFDDVELVLNCLNSLQRTIDCSALNVNDFCSLLETALVPLKCLEDAFKVLIKMIVCFNSCRILDVLMRDSAFIPESLKGLRFSFHSRIQFSIT